MYIEEDNDVKVENEVATKSSRSTTAVLAVTDSTILTTT